MRYGSSPSTARGAAGVTQRIDQMMRGEAVSVYPGVRNVHTPLYEDDYVEKTIAAAGIAKVGAEIVNVWVERKP